MPRGYGSSRTAPLPKNWAAIRVGILVRDGYRCTWTEHGDRCEETTGLEVDHLGKPWDHRPHMLRTLCAYHHRQKTSSEAGKLSSGRFRSNKRPQRRHPGQL